MRKSTKNLIGMCVVGLATSACVAVPVNENGMVYWEPVPAPLVPHVLANNPVPANLPARLYPKNSIARGNGAITGSVTNMMNGKGRFTLTYQGQTLVGEATRDSSGDEHSGIANAWSPQGTFMSCTYRMNNPRQGSGTCNFSDGAQYDVHLGG
ncbi:MAG: hypothetical protein ACWGNS_04550 [Burkholderiales bacterium]|jgi:hypothetical protein|nr:hypothetical protein [Betaproteobacteria bacterium]